MYEASVSDPDGFWAVHGQRLDWIKPYGRVKNTSFAPGNVSIKWFEDGTLNASVNCVDRHLGKRGDQAAIIWEGDDPDESRTITYRELHAEVCRFANVLKRHGVKRGDRVTLYLPMIPEAAYAMLACARIGAIHSIVFGGFSPDALASRIEGARSAVVITADEGLRGRAPSAAQGERGCRRRQGRLRDRDDRRPPHRRRRDDEGEPRLLSRRGSEKGLRPLRAGGDERGGPAVHPLHVRLDRHPEGRAPHDGGLPRLRVDDARTRVRLPRRRHLLVHGRCRLGDWPFLHRLRPASRTGRRR